MPGTKKFSSEFASRGTVKVTDKVLITNIDTGATEYTTVAALLSAFGFTMNGSNLGLGTATAGAQFEITSTTGGVLRIKRNTDPAAAEDVLGTVEFYTNDIDGPHIASFVKGIAAEAFGRKGALAFGVSKTNITDAVEVARFDENGNLVINGTVGTAKLQVVGLAEYADNAAAVTGGLTAGAFYRTGDLLKIVH